jgi:pimeloyl-[acyl-carrier protein] methyl ester esterase
MTSGLYWERSGHGPDVVLLHGWGMHGGVWQDLAQRLAQNFRVHVPDFPGHGRSRALEPFTLESCARELVASLPGPAVWIGWSLGGLVALQVARDQPPQVPRLVLIGSTPRFAQAPDWPWAMPGGTLEQFASELERDYRATLQRFLSLQCGHGETERELLRGLRATLFEHGEPDLPALRAGLDILKTADMRQILSTITAPTLVIHGARDQLVPRAAGEYLAAQLPQARLALIESAGHAPFLSHPEVVRQHLEEFLA